MPSNTSKLQNSNIVIIDGKSLALHIFVESVQSDSVEFRLSDEAWTNILYASSQLSKLLIEGATVYGLTTPCGQLDYMKVDPSAEESPQYELLRSHACGLGEHLPKEVVRGMMLGRLHVFAAGVSGVHVDIVRLLLEMLNRGVTPVVPSRGSVGASDLTSLAHLGLALIGEGRCYLHDTILTSQEALDRAGLHPVQLSGRDGLAIINGLEQSKSEGALLLARTSALLERAHLVAALSIIGSGCNIGFIDEHVIPYMSSEEERSAALMFHSLLQDYVPRNAHWRGSLSLRCSPQLFGAHARALQQAETSIQEVLHAVIDNPLLLPDGRLVNNTGYMHGQGLGERFDAMSTSLISLAICSERRLAQLIHAPAALDLPPFLSIPDSPISAQHGLMIAQYSAASTIALLRSMAIPSSIQSMPTSGSLEDHVPMCLQAIHRSDEVLALVEEVIAIELLTASYAIHAASVKLPDTLESFYSLCRHLLFEQKPPLPIHQQIQELLEYLRTPTRLEPGFDKNLQSDTLL